MIPYILWTTIQIGPIAIQVWGLFVAMGFLLGSFAASRMLLARGGVVDHVYHLSALFVLGGLIGGRLGYVFFYDFPRFLAEPLNIFAVWEGGSSLFGGLIACVLIFWVYARKYKLDTLLYADSLVFGLPFGLWIGRLGCFFIHDHPGTATHFFLGVQYPDGIIRHDHGLYLSLNAFFLSLLFLYLAKRRAPVGVYTGVFLVWYGAVRFLLDFYRIADVKYVGLTPAQYASIVMLLCGAVYGYNFLRKKYARTRERIF